MGYITTLTPQLHSSYLPSATSARTSLSTNCRYAGQRQQVFVAMGVLRPLCRCQRGCYLVLFCSYVPGWFPCRRCGDVPHWYSKWRRMTTRADGFLAKVVL